MRRAKAPAAGPGQSVTIPLVSGKYFENGATQWFANLGIGTPGQSLRIAIDTGGSFIWTTSSLCAPYSCLHAGGGRFVWEDSSTFHWVDQTPIPVDFGPWGSMTVEIGRDEIAFGAAAPLDLTMFLSEQYKGKQFDELVWDGGIGMPSGSDYSDPRSSYFPAELMNAGLWDPDMPFVSFITDEGSDSGSVSFGSVDLDAVDLHSAVFLPWTPYTAYPNEKCLWTTPLYQYLVGHDVVAAGNVQFCLDSGSSAFKGDDYIMERTLKLVGTTPPQPDVTLVLGITPSGEPARIVVPPSVYMVQVEGVQEPVPQFQPLGMKDAVLVGSVLMDQIYSVFWYDVTETGAGYHLAPIGMWIFNKKDGPQLIQTRSETPFELPRRKHNTGAGA
ncbi:MAG TPA: pepsin-like aspartic protease [Thermoanaerobaculia bacterium]|nr:pepsin-like aspartic protease [Thermoanaerobaculia bacterium]